MTDEAPTELGDESKEKASTANKVQSEVCNKVLKQMLK